MRSSNVINCKPPLKHTRTYTTGTQYTLYTVHVTRCLSLTLIEHDSEKGTQNYYNPKTPDTCMCVHTLYMV